MRVLQINSTCGVGSTGKITVDIYKALEDQGDECLIAFGRGKSPSTVNSYKIGSELSVKLHGLLSRITDRQGFYSLLPTKRLIKQIEKFDPDIIHLHNTHGYYLNLSVLFEYLSKANKPVVWTLHDCWAFTGHCAYFSFAGCDRWKNGCHNCPQKKAYPTSLLADNSRLNYKRKKSLFKSVKKLNLVTPSYWLEGLVKQSFLADFPVNTIYNGLDLNVFKPTYGNFKKEYGLEDKKIILGVANVWEERKGLKDFYRLDQIISEDYKIVLVGLSEKQKSALPESIVGITRTESVKQLAEIYTAADVYFNASVEETMGLTTVEAMACGTPVVVYNATAIGEVVDQKSGIVVEAGNVSAVYDAILDMSLSSNDCIKRAEDFEKNKQYKLYLALYDSLV